LRFHLPVFFFLFVSGFFKQNGISVTGELKRSGAMPYDIYGNVIDSYKRMVGKQLYEEEQSDREFFSRSFCAIESEPGCIIQYLLSENGCQNANVRVGFFKKCRFF